ncbi:hypothetical protein PR048_008508 [Dryococelus australis]|uniref:Uncharacterized protein n=1 Tax=Dryococelus australis TaxID=614101 RepID=A0ABQ9HY42_9NEOP|nr:hypothetical protein PR048_008508 [Dryococelus australis]
MKGRDKREIPEKNRRPAASSGTTCNMVHHITLQLGILVTYFGAAVAERLARSPPTKANRVQSLAGPPDFRKWESCQTMLLVGGFSSGISRFPRPFILAPLHIHFNYLHWLPRPRCAALKWVQAQDMGINTCRRHLVWCWASRSTEIGGVTVGHGGIQTSNVLLRTIPPQLVQMTLQIHLSCCSIWSQKLLMGERSKDLACQGSRLTSRRQARDTLAERGQALSC